MQELHDAGDWRGVVALEKEALALARELRGADPGLAGKIHGILGRGYYRTGDYGRARELHEQHRAICEALGDRAGVAGACGNLGDNSTEATVQFNRGRDHIRQQLTATYNADRGFIATSFNAKHQRCRGSTHVDAPPSTSMPSARTITTASTPSG